MSKPRPAEGARSGAPWTARLCDVICAAAALWTICCHAAVALGGSLVHVLVSASVLAVAGVVAFGWLRRRSGSTPRRADFGAAPLDRADFPLWGRALGVALGAATLAAYSVLGDPIALWWAGLATLLSGLIVTAVRCPQPIEPGPPSASRWNELVLVALGLVCALILLSFHRTDLDTPFYLSMAVAAADAPFAPLMLDSIHGIPGLGIHMPAHRVHSFEIFNGALSLLSGKPVIFCYQILTASVAAFLTPLAFARLFRILTPRHWPWSVLAVIAVLVGGGGTLWWYGNYSIVRIFHGKSVYMSVLLPLVYAYGLRFGARPSALRWTQLCAAQIAAVGCSSSALWSAPVAAGVAVACATRLDRSALRTLALGALASAYPLVLGLTLIGELSPVAADVVPAAAGDRLADALTRTFGGGRLELTALAAVLSGWTLYRRGPAQRFGLLVPLVVLATILNPYASEFVSRNVTGPSYWRAMWALPVPILLALLLTSPLQLDGLASRRWAGMLASTAAILGFVEFVPAYNTLSRLNQTVPGGFPKLTTPGIHYAVARSLSRLAPPGSMVVAPQKIAIWVPAFHQHPYVSYARETYLRRIEVELGSEEKELRMLLSEVVSLPASDIEVRIRRSPGFARRAADPNALHRFAEGLDHLDVRGVCLNVRAPLAPGVRQLLAARRFENRASSGGYEIWIRAE